VVLSVDDVVPLHLADVTFPDWHPLDGGTGAVLAFALRHPTGLLLFETGIGTGNQFIDAGVRVRQAGVTSLAPIRRARCRRVAVVGPLASGRSDQPAQGISSRARTVPPCTVSQNGFVPMWPMS
jgi:hypothetical protein